VDVSLGMGLFAELLEVECHIIVDYRPSFADDVLVGIFALSDMEAQSNDFL